MQKYNLEEFCRNESVKRACMVALTGLHSVHFIGTTKSEMRDFYGWVMRHDPTGNMHCDVDLVCQCGYSGSHYDECKCTTDAFLDWRTFIYRNDFDITIGVAEYTPEEIEAWEHNIPARGYTQSWVLAEIKRMASYQYKCTNMSLDHAPEAAHYLKAATERAHLSNEQQKRILSVARTVASLSGDEFILMPHLAEAVQYWPLRTRMGGFYA